MKLTYSCIFKAVFNFILVLAGHCLWAQTPTGGISGQVLSRDTIPLLQVTVWLKTAHQAVITDANGHYQFSGLKPGSYTLLFSHVGTKSRQRQVFIAAGQTVLIDLVLPEISSQLNDVNIVAGNTLNQKQLSAGKAGLPYIDLPQSGGVVNTQVIRDQQINHLGDAIRNVSGVTLTQTRGGVGETFTARGYSIGITGAASSVFKDGALTNTAGFPEASTLEAVEVLKGSSALLYGNVSGGLIINMVTKKPQFENGGELLMRYGSNQAIKPELDIYGPISNQFAYRAIAVYENDGSYRDHVYTDRKFVNPSVLYRPGKKTSVLLQGDYLRENITPDFGIGSLDTGRQIPRATPRSQYINTAWAYSHMDQFSGTATVKHQFADSTSINLISSAQSTRIDSYQASLPNTVSPIGDWYRGLARANTREDDYTAQLNLNTRFKTGTVVHQLLLGTDFQGVINFANTYSFNGLTSVKGVSYGVYDLVNTVNLAKYTARTDIPAANDTALTKSPSYRFGYYVQDFISINPKLKVLAGVRYSIQETEQTYITNFVSQTNRRGTSGTKSDRAFSPKIALIYQPAQTTSVYASYSNNFAINTGIDVATGQAMSPSIIDQYEVGTKNELFGSKLSVNVSVYTIVNHNLSVVSPVDLNGNANTSTAYRKFSGQTTSNGIELDISGSMSKNLYFITGYAYNHAYFSNTSGHYGSNIEGEPLVINPANTANGSVFYTFGKSALKGVKLGLSAFYTGFRYAGYNNTVGQAQKYNRLLPVEGFATVDVTAGYQYKKLSILVAITNITHTINYLIHDNYSITPIAPTRFATTLAYKF